MVLLYQLTFMISVAFRQQRRSRGLESWSSSSMWLESVIISETLTRSWPSSVSLLLFFQILSFQGHFDPCFVIP